MAKQLDPRLNGIDQFIAAYGVHVAAAQTKPNCDMDLYAVLGIKNALAVDSETVEKSCKKLALIVHPDKNSYVAAECAFKLISKAWNVLSQPSAKKAYDLRWGSTTRSSSNGGASSATYGARPCPSCNQWCNYENKNRSSINCSNCCRKYVFRSSWSRSSVPPRSSSSAACFL